MSYVQVGTDNDAGVISGEEPDPRVPAQRAFLGTARNAEERWHETLRRARAAGRVGVVRLTDYLDVTSNMIRCDLAAPERAGAVRPLHGGAGGAFPIGRLGFEPALAATHTAEKERIAKRAIAELPDGGTVIIDAGTTTGRLVDLFPAEPEFTVVVNSLPLAAALAMRANLTVIILGGRVRHRTLATVDDLGLNALRNLYVDVAFMATNGLSIQRGLTTPDPAEAEVKGAMIRAARRTVLLADHTKIGIAHFARFGSLGDVDLLITDSGLDDVVTGELELAGLQTVRS
jgi:DeoR family transcriptional regulator, fructose operon transcriptional repressor